MATEIHLSFEERASVRGRKRMPHPMRDGAAPWRDEIRSIMPPTAYNRMKDRESLAGERARLSDAEKTYAAKAAHRDRKALEARMSVPPANGWALFADLDEF